MANSNTEHSRKLRAKTSDEWKKKQRELGKIKQVLLNLPRETFEQYDKFCKENELTRAKALQVLLDAYNKE